MATPYLVRTQPWGAVAGAAGLGLFIVVVIASSSGLLQSPEDLVIGLRSAFVATSLGIAFVSSDATGELVEALPVPAWRLCAVRLALTLPALALSGAGQIVIGAHAFTVDDRLQGLGHRPLAWPGLASELVGFCGLLVIATAVVNRSRWRDLGGALAAPLGLGLIALLALLPLGLLPSTYLFSPTRVSHRTWEQAEWTWVAVAAVSGVIAAWANGDRWHRLRKR
jgi:hypothetical protein